MSGDMFSVGFLFYFGTTEGFHLYGNSETEREKNIKDNKPYYFKLISKNLKSEKKTKVSSGLTKYLEK